MNGIGNVSGLRVAAGLASVLVVSALTACGGASDESSRLTFTGSGGVTQEAMKSSSLDPFAAEHDVTITEDEPVDISKLKVMVDSGNVSWDVLHTVPLLVHSNCGTLFEPLDTSVVDLSNVPGELVSECAAPVSISGAILMYNADTYSPEHAPKTWSDFFDLENFPGKRGIGKTPQSGQFEAALLSEGISPDALYPIDTEKALAKLDSIKSNLVYYETGAQQQQQIESGEVDMVIGWPARAHAAVVNGANFEPVWTAAFYFPDVLAVTKGAKHSELAMEYINYAIGPEAQKAYSTTIPYAAVNSDVAPASDPLIDKFAPTQQKIEEFGMVQTDAQWWADNLDQMVKLWTDWINK